MATPPQRFFTDTDDDCHHFLVPVNLREAWEAWRRLSSDTSEAWTPPVGVKPIDGMHRLTFTDPQENP